MNIIVPLPITAAAISAGTTVAEPAPGETTWVSGGTYALSDLRIRSTTHRVYKCAQAHTGRTALPEDDELFWKDYGPTQRYAPFDGYISTAATGVTSLTYVLQPGFFNALSIYDLVGSGLSIKVKDAPGGAVIRSYDGDLYAQALGFYELSFTPPMALDKLVLTDIPISPTAELTITITAGVGDPVGVGMINVGDFRAVIGDADWGGVEYGARGDLKDYSYIKYADDGSWTIVRRGSATDISGSVSMPAASAEYAHALIKQVLSVPVSCIATPANGYSYLNAFGMIAGSVVADSSGKASFNFSVKASI